MKDLLRSNVESGGNNPGIEVDRMFNAIKIIDTVHSEIHEGEHWTLVDSDEKNALQYKYYSFVAPSAEYAHFVCEVGLSNTGVVGFYEGSTLTATGTAITPNNNDRNNITSTTGMLCYEDVGPSVAGTLLNYFVIGSSSPSAKIGGITGTRNEWILKKGTRYLLIILVDNNNTKIALDATWYE